MWDQFLAELPLLRDISLPRHINVRQARDIQLLGFSDASQKAYAAVSYLRMMNECGEIKVYFLACKTKVTPLKAGKIDPLFSISQLELCATLLLAQLLNKLYTTRSEEISISKICTWTNSTYIWSRLKAELKNFRDESYSQNPQSS